MERHDGAVGMAPPDRPLTEAELRSVLAEGLRGASLAGCRMLVIIPDATRTAPVPLFFRLLCDMLMPSAAQLDFMVALGTHPALGEEAINRLVGISEPERKGRYCAVGISNHRWNAPGQLATLGTLSAGEISSLTGGKLRRELVVTINRAALEYDHILICGPVFPHEVVGFSGGNKYFFPGISGGEIIDVTHWLGALIGCRSVIGTLHTPVRAVIDRAARLVPTPRTCASMVVAGKGLAGLYVGSPEAAWLAAARLSRRLHITWVEAPFRRALAVIPAMYDDLWTGAKGVYKLEPAIVDGGEIILYAPHITEFSYTHGAMLEEIGFHGSEYFTHHWDRYCRYPWAVLAHSAHVRGEATYTGGRETPRINVTLASRISRRRCERMGLGYLDPSHIDVGAWRNREQDGLLLAEPAGERLYRLRPQTV